MIGSNLPVDYVKPNKQYKFDKHKNNRLLKFLINFIPSKNKRKNMRKKYGIK